MPVLAVVGAYIGTTALGATIAGAIGTGLVAQTIGFAIAGAIGGAIGGGIGSVMQGGDFWEGAKAGAIGGALSGAFVGVGGVEGISNALSPAAPVAEVALNTTTPFLGAEGMGVVEPTNFGSLAAEQTLAASRAITPLSLEDALSSIPAQGQALSGQGSALAGQGLGSQGLAQTVGSAPTQGTLDSGTGMASVGQAGAQTAQQPFSLRDALGDYGKLDQNQIALLGYNQAVQGQRQSQLSDMLAGQREKNAGLLNFARGAYTSADERSKSLQARIDNLFARYGVRQ